MENNNNPLDQLFREKLGDHEVPYNSTHWREMEAKLDAATTTPAPTNGSVSKLLTLAGGVAAVALLSYLIFSPETPDNSALLTNQSTEQSTAQEVATEEVEESTPQLEKTSNTTPNNTTAEAKVNENTRPEETQVNEAPSVDRQMDKISANNAQKRKQEANLQLKGSELDQPKNDPSTDKFENPELKTAIAISHKTACVGEEIQFAPSREIQGASYFWNFGDGGITSTQRNPKRAFNSPGTYSVLLIVSKGEKNTNTSETEITILPAPQLDFKWDSEHLSLNDPYVKFSANTNGQDVDFTWEIEDQTYRKPNPEHLFKKEGSYDIVLTGKAKGCVVSVRHNVYVVPVTIPMENAFTLNGDGLNDTYPAVLASLNVPFKMEIYSKTGNLMYQTEDPNQPWNGRLNNSGDIAPQDIYTCLITTKDKYGVEHKNTKRFHLLRY